MADDGRVLVDSTERSWRHRLRFVSWIAIALAAIAAVLTGTGVAAAADGEFVAGTSLAWAAIVVSAVAVAAGVVALVVGAGRLGGAIAIAVGLLANPFLLTQLLGAASAVAT